jgi:hypothetical protein
MSQQCMGESTSLDSHFKTSIMIGDMVICRGQQELNNPPARFLPFNKVGR